MEKDRRERSPAHQRVGKDAPAYDGEMAAMTSRHKRPDNRLTLVEFIQCLSAIILYARQPKHGTYDNKSKVLPLPECFEVMMKLMLENAKQDKSSLFREELREDEKRQAVFSQYLPELKYWFSEVTRLTGRRRHRTKSR